MPRPTCPRLIAHQPPCSYFKPAGIPMRELEETILLPEEVESLRLADAENLYRVDAAARMGVSRQTFDRIVRKARQKVAIAITQGRALRIEGLASPGTASGEP
jgi:uncharacterized protein